MGLIRLAATVFLLVGTTAISAQAQLNLIRPGQKGRFPINKVTTVQPELKVIGELGGYEISEMKSPVQVSSMGKSMAMDSKGYIWFVETREDKEIRIDPKTLEMTVYQLPAGGAPYSIAIDGNDTHWVTAHGIETLLELHPEEGYCVAHLPPSKGFLIHLATDNRNNTVYISQPGTNQVLSFHPERGFKEYLMPTKNSGPARLSVDKLGDVWVTEIYAGKLARLRIADGEFDEWELPTPEALPAFCRVEDDGGVWVSEPAVDKIAYFKDGKFKEYDIPTKGSIVSSNIRDLEGRVWFSEGGWRGSAGGNKIGILWPDDGKVEEFLLPTPLAQPLGLLRDQQGAIWFEQSTGGKIGRAVKTRLIANRAGDGN